uniref:Uncharacterized protein n=2 Tax=Picea TaxID=3328 RepID=A0A101LZC6_PICGL|nr:hypothetical protein ABT39_MTgene5165 [Picea glauca]QHR91651.1 hypothetical protein Q903MT_gene5687 [Picea sitchensis]
MQRINNDLPFVCQPHPATTEQLVRMDLIHLSTCMSNIYSHSSLFKQEMRRGGRTKLRWIKPLWRG